MVKIEKKVIEFNESIEDQRETMTTPINQLDDAWIDKLVDEIDSIVYNEQYHHINRQKPQMKQAIKAHINHHTAEVLKGLEGKKLTMYASEPDSNYPATYKRFDAVPLEVLEKERKRYER